MTVLSPKTRCLEIDTTRLFGRGLERMSSIIADLVPCIFAISHFKSKNPLTRWLTHIQSINLSINQSINDLTVVSKCCALFIVTTVPIFYQSHLSLVFWDLPESNNIKDSQVHGRILPWSLVYCLYCNIQGMVCLNNNI